MECKVEEIPEDVQDKIVLIETLWNVKHSFSIQVLHVFSVLIETLWNVKTTDADALIGRICINRNIVECKEVQCLFRKRYRPRINRNIVECKDDPEPFHSDQRIRINRKIVECKVSSLTIFFIGSRY